MRRRAALLGAWLVAALLLLPRAFHADERLEVSARIVGSESEAVERMLAERFESPFAHSAVLVLSGVSSPATENGHQALLAVVAALRERPEVTGTFSYLDQQDPYFAGSAGGTFLLVGLAAPDGRVDRLLPGLRAASAALERGLRQRDPGARLSWTGEAAINFDLWRSSADDAHAAERRTAPLTLAILLLVFGSVAAAAVPAAAGALAAGLSLGLVALAAQRWALSVLTINVVSMLGLALGIDYALLSVSRFREARGAGADPASAARIAARRAGGTIALSGASVAIGFAVLLLVPLQELRSAALGGLLVVVISVLVAVGLVPDALAWLGPRLEAGRLFAPRAEAWPRRWRVWSRVVCGHPWSVLLLAGVPLLGLAAQAARLNPHIPRGDWLPADSESARALAELRAMGRSGVVGTLRVLLELPETTGALEDDGWRAQKRLAERLAAEPLVARVQSLRAVAGDRADDLGYVSLLPAQAKRSFVDSEGGAVLLEAVPREEADPEDVANLVRELRRKGGAALSGLAGSRLRIGGLPAFNADYEDAVGARAGLVVGAVVLATLVALFVGFRSLLVPVKAVALNLLSVASAFGALVLVFQDGYGLRWFGLDAPLDGVFPIVPPLVFCTVFGLSMDYEVFLVARVAEARRGGLAEEEALGFALERTGGVITSAAAVMIAVFGAFTLGGFVLVKMLGFALAVAVLLDATIVRAAIGPALLRLAGRWNWWPGG